MITSSPTLKETALNALCLALLDAALPLEHQFAALSLPCGGCLVVGEGDRGIFAIHSGVEAWSLSPDDLEQQLEAVIGTAEVVFTKFKEAIAGKFVSAV